MILETEPLRNAVSLIDGLVPLKLQEQLLGFTLFDARDGSCTLTGQDTEMILTLELDATCGQSERLCVPPRRLKAFLATLPGDQVEVRLSDKGKAYFGQGKTCVGLPTGDVASYPEQVWPAAGTHWLGVDGDALKDAITFASLSTNPLSAASCLAGVTLLIRDRALYASGQDNHVSISEVGLVDSDDSECIITVQASKTLSRLLAGDVQVAVSPHLLSVRGAGFTFRTRVLGGTVRDPLRLWPQLAIDHTLELDLERMAQALSVMATVEHPQSHGGARFEFHAGFIRVVRRVPGTVAQDQWEFPCGFEHNLTLSVEKFGRYVRRLASPARCHLAHVGGTQCLVLESGRHRVAIAEMCDP